MNMHKLSIVICFVFLSFINVFSQSNSVIPSVWTPDLGNGFYKNPVLNADYSDPDVCRVGNDFYMTASSFDAVPGLPVLHSKDLVNWKLIGHALVRQVPVEHFSKVQHGNGVWAPAIRYHKGEFYIYYPDPDFGIYLVKAKNPVGPWTEPVLVEGGKGLIDPCPFWDNDGQTFLIHGWAGSRAGIKSILTLKKMNPAGTKITNEGMIVYDGHQIDPTVEGPKLYKRSGFYYIFAPAGGVATGWQLALRSKNIYGPYERRVVMDQGSTSVNGPHQGAWVATPNGENWFLHFQDKGVYGRVVHLQPMVWKNGWPVIGEDKDGDGKGQPVLKYKKPVIAKVFPMVSPPESDEFDGTTLGLQWQWQANPNGIWHSLTNTGHLRLYSNKIPENAVNLWEVPNVLMQKFPAEEFQVVTKLQFSPNEKLENEKTGLAVMGRNYASLYLKSKKNGGASLVFGICEKAYEHSPEMLTEISEIDPLNPVFLKLIVKKGGICTYSYSLDGINFTKIDRQFQAVEGQWIGAKMGIFCIRETQINDSGYTDFDWFRVQKVD